MMKKIENDKIKEQELKEYNKKALDLLNVNLCYLIQNQYKVISQITEENCPELFKHRSRIIDTNLLKIHLDRFGPFKVTELREENPLCFKPVMSSDEEIVVGEVEAFGQGYEKWMCWWGQRTGPLHVEIGIRMGEPS